MLRDLMVKVERIVAGDGTCADKNNRGVVKQGTDSIENGTELCSRKKLFLGLHEDIIVVGGALQNIMHVGGCRGVLLHQGSKEAGAGSEQPNQDVPGSAMVVHGTSVERTTACAHRRETTDHCD